MCLSSCNQKTYRYIENKHTHTHSHDVCCREKGCDVDKLVWIWRNFVFKMKKQDHKTSLQLVIDWIATHRSHILSHTLFRFRRMPLFCCRALYLSILAVSLLNHTTDKYGSPVQIFIDKINSKRLSDHSNSQYANGCNDHSWMVRRQSTYATKLIELFNIWRYNSFEHNYFINIFNGNG